MKQSIIITISAVAVIGLAVFLVIPSHKDVPPPTPMPTGSDMMRSMHPNYVAPALNQNTGAHATPGPANDAAHGCGESGKNFDFIGDQNGSLGKQLKDACDKAR